MLVRFRTFYRVRPLSFWLRVAAGLTVSGTIVAAWAGFSKLHLAVIVACALTVLIILFYLDRRITALFKAISKLNYSSDNNLSENARYVYPEEYIFLEADGNDELSKTEQVINTLTRGYQLSQKHHLSFELAQKQRFIDYKAHTSKSIHTANKYLQNVASNLLMLKEDIQIAKSGKANVLSTLEHVSEVLKTSSHDVGVSIEAIKDVTKPGAQPPDSYVKVGYLAKMFKQFANGAFSIAVSDEISDHFISIDSLKSQALAHQCSKFILGREPKDSNEGKAGISFTGNKKDALVNFTMRFRPLPESPSNITKEQVLLLNRLLNGVEPLSEIEGILVESEVVMLWDLSKELNASLIPRWLEPDGIPEILLTITTKSYEVPPVIEPVSTMDTEADAHNVVPLTLITNKS